MNRPRLTKIVLFVAGAALAVACGGILPFGDDDENELPPSVPLAADAADDADRDGASSDGNGEAAVGQDSGFVCVPSKKCADDEFECCSGQRGTGCTMKCEITCCL